MIKVLFVCLGNICRSPSAEGVFRDLVRQNGLADKISIDSAGTGAWHVGNSPDKRSQKVALTRGYDISDLRARQTKTADFREFDYILAMDRNNYADLMEQSIPGEEHRIHMFLSFGKDSPEEEVPDPYYGGPAGFDYVLDLIENAAEGLLADIKQKHL